MDSSSGKRANSVVALHYSEGVGNCARAMKDDGDKTERLP